MSSPEHCPSGLEGKHQPDFNSLHVEYDGEAAYIDLNCSRCGRSGCCGKFDPAEVTW